MADRRDFFEHVVYHGLDHRRFTQQSPVMPDVWIQYAMHPGEQQQLLMVPDYHYTTADLSAALRKRIAGDTTTMARLRLVSKRIGPPAVVHNQNVVAATLWFDELVRAVLPLSGWWRDAIARVRQRDDSDALHARLGDQAGFVSGLVAAWRANDPESVDVLWLARVAGLIAHISSAPGRRLVRADMTEEEKVRALQRLLGDHEALARALATVLAGIEPVYPGDNYPLFTVNLNRRGGTALTDSTRSVKANATSRVFNVRGKGIRWALIDSGVDATHVAFRKRNDDGTAKLQPFGRPRRHRTRGPAASHFINNTRVIATWDFVHIRDLLGAEPDEVDKLSREWFPALKSAKMRAGLKTILEDYPTRAVDWERLEPFLEVKHTPKAYRPPVHRHGTHVAGIMGADWRTTDEAAGLAAPREDMTGMCPEIEIVDLRVLDENGEGDEFAIMSAMQFIRDRNARKDFVAVHGVNLSLSIPHDVANYACGRTPVCEEAARLVGSGLVVVAAAGNSGRARYLTPSNEIDDGFRTVSITDPGNTDAVITVGSTHRRDPHTYGVSYFSSRGPTGDGRLKPDLVAPGEKIRSTVPGDGDDRMDGTSMAAPHVSGAAALIMARHPELVGQPRRLKEILCRSATDLDRERYFQGAGLLDILRALQSI